MDTKKNEEGRDDERIYISPGPYIVNQQLFEFPEQILRLELNLVSLLEGIDFGPSVANVYNPISYAFDVHSKFVKKFCNGCKEVLFLGMNPGPWGMMQNGVPFGECNAVVQFLGLSGTVKKPEREHPLKQVLGLNCARSEPSGKRFWALASELGAGDPFKFFSHAFVYNYFPFALISSAGKNVTPPELQASTQRIIEAACDNALKGILTLLRVKVVIAIGRFAETRVQGIIKKLNIPDVKVFFIPHPSPRNPKSNKGWIPECKQLLIDYDLAKYFYI